VQLAGQRTLPATLGRAAGACWGRAPGITNNAVPGTGSAGALLLVIFHRRALLH
jgi:hypothetical protein